MKTNQGGRPPKPENEKLKLRPFRADDATFRMWQEKAKRRGMKEAEYLRYLIKNDPV